MKKGFTLIELLAVIVILAIIALIATPIILNIIDEAKDNASLRSADLYLDAVENSILIAELNNRRITDGVYNVLDNGNLCLEYDSEDKCIDELVIEVKGEKPNNGEITIKDGKIENISLNLNNKVIVKDNNNKLVAIKQTPVECFTYSDNEDGTITITGYTCGGENGTHKDVVISRKIDGKLVTTIGDSAFRNNQLTSVVIHDSVTTIGRSAFRENQLTSIMIPDSVTTIGNYAFQSNQLTSVTIPDGLIIIGEGVFYHNKLTSVVIPESVTTMKWGAFCDNLLMSVTIPNSVTTIAAEVFSYNQLTSVTIPDSVTTIGHLAFAHNKLTSATIGTGVTTMVSSAFLDNQLTSVVIKGKSSKADFKEYDPYNSGVFGWADGYGDANITWQP